MMHIFFWACVSALVAFVPVAHSMDKNRELFVGTEIDVNQGVVTTNQSFLNGTTNVVGYTIDDTSARPNEDLVELFVGLEDKTNLGVVTTDKRYKNGATESIGYLSKKPVPGGTKLFVGTQDDCSNVVVTSIFPLNCSTKFLGYALPE
jgi:hypothetical protein